MDTKYNLHRTNILKTIYEKGQISRKKLHDLLDIRFATITDITKELIIQGIIEESGKERNEKGGRPHSLLRIVPDSKFFIGCELNVEKIIGVILNFEGRIISKEKLKIEKNESKEEIKRKIIALLKNLIFKSQVEKTKISGIGFVDPGLVDVEKGISLFSSILPQWRDIFIKKYIEDEISIETYVIGTSQAKVLSEKFFGKGKNYKNFIFIEYGEGISCGIISENKVIHGIGGVAGEFGHIKITGRKEICNCGGIGCLEAIASIPSILKKVRDVKGKDLKIEEVVKGYIKGDEEIKKVLDEIFEILCLSISNLINLFNPEMIIFDRQFQIFIEILDKFVEKITKNMVYNYPLKFEFSEFGEEIGAIGGGCLSIGKFLKLDI